MSVTFPNGWTLKRAKDVLVGARVHTGAIVGGDTRNVRWNESQITNVTSDALVVGMLTMHDRIVVVSPRRSSFLIESGRLRSGLENERYSVAIHPAEMGYLHRILGLPVLADEERAIAEDDAACAGVSLNAEPSR